jgi:NTE family protein
MEHVGIALGGGGAKGISHVVVLETLEEMGLKPLFV